MLRHALEGLDRAILTSEDALLYNFHQMCAFNRTGDLQKLAGFSTNVYQIFDIPASSPYLPQVNRIVMRMTEFGVTGKIVDEFVDPTGIRREMRSPDTGLEEYVPLSLNHMFSSFAYFIGGLVLSVFVFILEFLVHFITK